MPLYPKVTAGATISSTAVGSEPGSPATGDMDRYTDGAVVARYNGTDWNSTWGPTWPLTRPRLADYTAINQSTATIAERGGGIGIDAPAVGGENWRVLVKSTPSTPYTLTVAWLVTMTASGVGAGLILRQSSDGKLMIFRYLYGNAFVISQYSSATSFTGNASSAPSTTLVPPTPFVWLQMGDNGTNRIWRYSCDGIHFVDFYTEARTTYLTADQWGFGLNSGGGAVSALWLHAGAS